MREFQVKSVAVYLNDVFVLEVGQKFGLAHGIDGLVSVHLAQSNHFEHFPATAATVRVASVVGVFAYGSFLALRSVTR